MRVAIAGLWHETNTYSARPTDLESFRAFELLVGEAILEEHAGKGTVIGGILAQGGFDPVPIATAGAWPAGRVTREAQEELYGRLERGFRAAGPLDGVILDLHGAMVGEGLDDAELAAVEVVREAASSVPLVAVHDLHGNPSPEMAGRCDALISYETYPHVDMAERGREAALLMSELLGGASYRTLVRKTPLLICPLAQATDAPPISQLRDRATELEREPGVRRISLLPGFPYSDVARAGFSTVVVHEEGGDEAAREAGGELADQVMTRREEWVVERPGPAEAVGQALEGAQPPVILVDVADNIGGGSPGDGTALLAELLAQGAEGAVVSIADPEVARRAAGLGVESAIEVRVGGKTDRLHGDPVPIEGRVVRLTDGRYRSEGTWQTGREFTMGTTAVIQVGGVSLVVMERATPPFHGEQLRSVGIEPAEAAIVTVKGAIAWRAAYGDVAGTVLEVDTPGICPVDPGVLARTTEPMGV
ncbi:MAG: M81 family metallopeptidase [Acidimicrobiia bacterium]